MSQRSFAGAYIAFNSYKIILHHLPWQATNKGIKNES
jgi:hypothetical protein